ncbi:nitroreductase family protein, partial [Aurantimonas sp. A3-2-R12]|uniref:nitroreductase family protein n=1 Tax=Aurantimonas sp. A3-2-R12 TaxID=3114362 RepID=UPI002E16BFE0|nr:nitroreductase family protein [Aurantimonas sp. A3-2-R12]
AATTQAYRSFGRFWQASAPATIRRLLRPHHPFSAIARAVMRAIDLAANTPRACNRQSWFTYHIDDRAVIEKALSFQTGNQGFGHEVPYLIIISADLRAFDNANERNQHFIDGGMYSMALVMALHALGLQSCCLNWSKLVRDDRAIRKHLPIKNEHTIIMMLAVGCANESIKVGNVPVSVETLKWAALPALSR